MRCCPRTRCSPSVAAAPGLTLPCRSVSQTLLGITSPSSLQHPVPVETALREGRDRLRARLLHRGEVGVGAQAARLGRGLAELTVELGGLGLAVGDLVVGQHDAHDREERERQHADDHVRQARPVRDGARSPRRSSGGIRLTGRIATPPARGRRRRSAARRSASSRPASGRGRPTSQRSPRSRASRSRRPGIVVPGPQTTSPRPRPRRPGRRSTRATAAARRRASPRPPISASRAAVDDLGVARRSPRPGVSRPTWPSHWRACSSVSPRRSASF